MAAVQPPKALSTRGRELFQHDGFLFHFCSISACGTKKFWRCIKRHNGCKARLHTSVETGEVLPTMMAGHVQHNHASDPAAIEYVAARSTMKLLAADSNENPEQIMAHAAQGLSLSAKAQLETSYCAVKRMIQRCRNTIQPCHVGQYDHHQESTSSSALDQASWDFNLTESVGKTGLQCSNAKRLKLEQHDPAEAGVVGEMPLTDQQFLEQRCFVENQIYPETYEEYGDTSQEGFPIEQYVSDSASPQMCVDSVASNDILTTLVRNQQLMLDAIQRLESKLDNVQHDFNIRLTTLEKHTASVLTFATEQREVVRQIQKACAIVETKLDNFIAANNSYSNPASISSHNICSNEFSSSVNAVAQCTTRANSAVETSTVTGKQGNETAFKSNGAAGASTSSCQRLEPVIITRNLSRDIDDTVASSFHNKGGSGMKLHLDPQDSGVGWIGGNPKLAIPVSEYLSLLSKSEGSALQLLFALLLQTCSGPNNLKRLLLIDKDGRRFFKQDLLFDSCVTQVCLQFPAFQMNNSISLQLAERIAKLCENHTVQFLQLSEKGTAAVMSDEDSCGILEIPVRTVKSDETHHDQLLPVKEEVGEII